MYCDYDFYKSSFGGTFILESEFSKYEELAESHIDAITFNRLTDWMPENPKQLRKIKYAVCSVADELKRADSLEYSKSVMVSNMSTADGLVTSRSSGNESVSMESRTGALNAIVGSKETDVNERIYSIAVRHLTGITKDGVNILYAGL